MKNIARAAALILLLLPGVVALRPSRGSVRATARRLTAQAMTSHAWAPQDLTLDVPGRAPIPDDDYVKLYQADPALWPVEFFVIIYRRKSDGTSVLVRRSANGTSKWGLGTGAPATRWTLSSAKTPVGYERSGPQIDASAFPEFAADESWTYDKIDLRADAFDGDLADPKLAAFAAEVREAMRASLLERTPTDWWDASTLFTALRILESQSSVAGIQGALRMSGLFSSDGVPFGAVDPAALAASARIYAMFPQMPDPMLDPLASPEEVRREIETRAARMAESGRDPHADKHGRIYTHISTPNVSNTIRGIYLTLDATALGDFDAPALDLFGTAELAREWRTLEELKVLDGNGRLGTADPKPTFISGFIVRRLVEEGVIDVRG